MIQFYVYSFAILHQKSYFCLLPAYIQLCLGKIEKSGTGIYNVMLRGINRQDIFEDAEDYKQFIKMIRLLVDWKDDNNLPLPPLCTVYAYCLINNHVHLLIRPLTAFFKT